MRAFLLSAAVSVLALSVPAITTNLPDAVEQLAARGLQIRQSYDILQETPASPSCNWENVAVRREWSALSKSARREYIDAVLCLMEKPPITATSEFPGVRNRYDDFLATHINQTLYIHGTGNFLTWHRYFVWAYEQALRNECGYKGYQPYWNWGDYSDDPIHSALFDGSEFSMSGNGDYMGPHKGANATGYTILPPGEGGGCVTTGPFKDMSVNLGPVAPTLDGVKPNGDGRGYNPRCLRRDISTFAAQGWAKTSDAAWLISENHDIYWFQTMMQGQFEQGFLGVHTAGHYTIGGDPGGDLFVSPGDPAFYLHHAQIDRTFWIWQNLDPERRLKALSGTITVNNTPPSRNATLDDIVELGLNGDPYELVDLLDTTGGPFCYIYG